MYPLRVVVHLIFPDKGLVAIITLKRLDAVMDEHVGLEVLKSGEGFATSWADGLFLMGGDRLKMMMQNINRINNMNE